MQLGALSAYNLGNFLVYKWENAYIKDLNAWRILMNFLCFYLDEGNGGGGALVHVYTYENPIAKSAFSTEPLDGCLRNLVRMKY